MKEKIIILTIFLLALLQVDFVYANNAEVIVGSKSAQAGEVIEIEISLKNNPGIIAAMFNIRYDTSRLKLLSTEDKGLLEGGTFSEDNGECPYVLLWNSAANTDFADDGVLVVLKFIVLDMAQPGKAFINLTYEPDNVYDVKLNNVLFNIKNGCIDIKSNNAYTTKNKSARVSTIENKDAISDEKSLVHEKNQIIFTINNKKVNVFGIEMDIDVSPLLKNDRAMIPIRYAAEFLGARVLWKETSPDNGEVIVIKNNTKIRFIVGENVMKKNETKYSMEVCPFIEKDRTYVPIRYVAEALDISVVWNSETNQVIISK